MKKITKSDIVTHKKFIDSLITRYSEYINNYDFDDLYKIINTDDKFLDKMRLLYARDINSVENLVGTELDDSSWIAWRYLVSALQELESFDNIFKEFVNKGLKDRYNYGPFTAWIIDNCSTLELQTVPTWIFSDAMFNCDIHIKAEKLLSNALTGVNLHNHDLYIDNGCTEIGLMAFYRAWDINHVHLPSTLNKLDLQAWNANAIYYDGTIDQFLNLIKQSSWKSAARVHTGSNKSLIQVDIICNNGTIKKDTKLDRNYDIID